eukprot:TRINITY_DN4448_c0_g1_i3.p1 TRINITY_DN4448_c0_g1~~TRINITY_DN4448_c0_g1_i3.p1  ORF type:complete len:413 (-),score=78.67 TRINITY_DN4448_c0_g1_i3:202-1440(-)
MLLRPSRHATTHFTRNIKNNTRERKETTLIKRKYNSSLTLKRKLVEIDNTMENYKNVSTSDIRRSLTVLKLCKKFSDWGLIDILVKMSGATIDRVLYFVLKRTPFFTQFVAGESIEESVRLLKSKPFYSIINYSVERSPSDETVKEIMKVTLQKIEAARENGVTFVSFKLSGLVDHSVFVELTKRYDSVDLDALMKADTNEQFVEVLNQAEALSEEAKQLILELLQRTDHIYTKTVESKIRILIDAEQSYYQPAIHLLSLFSFKRYNQEFPWLYNTYQFYLKVTLDIARSHLKLAEKYNFQPGFKCVRGAYMEEEARRAQLMGYENPIQPSEQHTHTSYDTGISEILEKIKDGKKYGLLVASHNRHSVELANRFLVENNLPDDIEVYYGQLMVIPFILLIFRECVITSHMRS